MVFRVSFRIFVEGGQIGIYGGSGGAQGKIAVKLNIYYLALLVVYSLNLRLPRGGKKIPPPPPPERNPGIVVLHCGLMD